MCDTFVAMPSITRDGSVLFGKNSDREPNESQSLEQIPEQQHPQDSRLQTTYLSIPQVPHTNAILISRPFWMWGAEMGANDRGVVIGNEAVFTRMPVAKRKVLTGMDMLRLALERADSAQQAMEVIIGLLADFGQGGICGYQDKHLKYHNSYIITDAREAWVMETAGGLWIGKQVNDYYAISNGLTIGAEYDVSHPDLIPIARKKGFLKKGREFNFAECYSDWFFTTFSACRKRRQRSQNILENKKNSLDVSATMALLRDHTHEVYRPDSHFLMQTICAHSANKISRHSAQTTGSLIAHLKNKDHTFWATGTAAPCTGLFKPIRFALGKILAPGPAPRAKFESHSLWWQHEILHRSVLLDFNPRLRIFLSEKAEMEKKWQEQVRLDESPELSTLTQSAFEQARKKTTEWIKQIQQQQPGPSSYFYRSYWKRQNKKAEFPTGLIR